MAPSCCRLGQRVGQLERVAPADGKVVDQCEPHLVPRTGRASLRQEDGDVDRWCLVLWSNRPPQVTSRSPGAVRVAAVLRPAAAGL